MSALRFRNIYGFTLIELMVVMSILAILATVGVVTYTNTQKVARDGKRMGDIQEIQKAVEQYYALNQKYPGSNGDTNGFPTAYTTALQSYFASGTIPKQATNSANYFYIPCSNQNRYNICTGLETCNNKCTNTVTPGNGCTAAPVGAAGNAVYCVSNISTN